MKDGLVKSPTGFRKLLICQCLPLVLDVTCNITKHIVVHSCLATCEFRERSSGKPPEVDIIYLFSLLNFCKTNGQFPILKARCRAT